MATPSDFPAELKLLIAACHPEPDLRTLQAMLARTPRLDPAAFTYWANRHRVANLAYSTLRQHQTEVQLPDVLENLTKSAGNNLLDALTAAKLNVKLSRLFRANNIPFLPLKGSTLARRYYSDIGQRHACDVDILVAAQDLDRVRKLLLGLGCQLEGVHFPEQIADRGSKHRAFLLNYGHDEVFFHPDGPSIEIHWRLTDNPSILSIGVEELLQKANHVELSNELLPVQDPVHLLIYLCQHGASHCWYRLKWLADIPRLLGRHDWDWDKVLLEAHRLGCLSSLFLGLKLSQIFFGWTVPVEVRQAMNRQFLLNWQIRSVCRSLMAPENEFSSPQAKDHIRQSLFKISLVDSPQSLWGELSHYFLTPNDVKLIALPDHMFTLNYVLRPFLFFWRRITGL